MRVIYFLLVCCCIGCTEQNVQTDNYTDTTVTETTEEQATSITRDTTPHYAPESGRDMETEPIEKQPETYSNKRFRNVTVKKTNDNTFLISGQGQIFEASFGWYIEDGHEILKDSFATTDAGAPEWGNFNITITASKKRPNSTLHLVLYETSAKDGSKQYELPIPLY